MKSARLAPAFCVVALFASVAPPAALAKLSQTGTASAQFKDAESVPGAFLTGTTTRVTLADDGTTVTLTVQLESLKTSQSLYDKQLRSTLEVGTYPTASFKVTRKSLRFLSSRSSASGAASGSLTLHGATKPVKFKYHATLTNATYRVTLTASIDDGEFGIKFLSLLGVSYNQEVQLSSTFSAIDR
jgi:polyisoprenoid-binding protein YceI